MFNRLIVYNMFDYYFHSMNVWVCSISDAECMDSHFKLLMSQVYDWFIMLYCMCFMLYLSDWRDYSVFSVIILWFIFTEKDINISVYRRLIAIYINTKWRRFFIIHDTWTNSSFYESFTYRTLKDKNIRNMLGFSRTMHVRLKMKCCLLVTYYSILRISCNGQDMFRSFEVTF